MKYKDPVTGELKDIIIKSGDTLPIGTIVEIQGDVIPDGYEEVNGSNYVVENTDALLTNVVSRNLFNKNEVILGKRLINASDGLYDSPSNSTSNYIEIEANSNYYISNFNACHIFDSNYNYIKQYYSLDGPNISEKIATPSNAKFIKISTNIATLDICQLEQGSTPTTYTPYLNLQELQEAQAVNALTVGISRTHTTTQTIEKLTLNTIETQIGGNFSVSNGNVLIGKGINAIRISGQILFSDVDTNNKRLVMIIEKNSETVGYSENIGKGLYETINLSNIILKVNEGDIISLKAGSYSSSGLKISNNINRTFITIEKI